MHPTPSTTHPAPLDPQQPVPIVALIYASGRPRRATQMIWGITMALMAHGLLAYVALGLKPSMESWSAQLAMRVHAELTKQEMIELPTPPIPSKPLPRPRASSSAAAAPRAPQHRTSNTPPPPAHAGTIIAQQERAQQPVDLTGNTFVTGSATAYAGGTTTSQGTNANAVNTSHVDPNAAPPRSPGDPNLAHDVQLPDAEWHCPWPSEANDQQIDEQTAVIRVVVRADGTVVSATIVRDPGHGFGAAALACARTARFSPATDADGNAIQSQSPPIRVRFTR